MDITEANIYVGAAVFLASLGATCVRSTFHRLPFRRPSRLANGAAGEEKDAEREPELSLDNENVPPSRGGMATPSAQGTPGSSAFSSTAKSWRSPGASTGSPLSPSPRRSPLAPRLLNVPTPMSAPSSNVKRRVSAASLASGLRNRNSTASRARLPSAADSAPRAPAPTPADTPLRAGVAADKLRKRPLPLEHVAAAPSAAPVGEVAPMAPRAMETSPRQTSARKKPTPGANTPAVAGRAEASSEKRRRTPLSQRFRQNAALLDSNAEAQAILSPFSPPSFASPLRLSRRGAKSPAGASASAKAGASPRAAGPAQSPAAAAAPAAAVHKGPAGVAQSIMAAVAQASAAGGAAAAGTPRSTRAAALRASQEADGPAAALLQSPAGAMPAGTPRSSGRRASVAAAGAAAAEADAAAPASPARGGAASPAPAGSDDTPPRARSALEASPPVPTGGGAAPDASAPEDGPSKLSSSAGGSPASGGRAKRAQRGKGVGGAGGAGAPGRKRASPQGGAGGAGDGDDERAQKQPRRGADAPACGAAGPDALPRTFCALIQRDVTELSVERHRQILVSTFVVTERTLRNLLQGKIANLAEDKPGLIDQYLALLHPRAKPGRAETPRVIRSAAKRPAPARGRAGAAAKHLGFTPVKPPAARGAAGDAAAAAGGVAVGDTLEVERCSFAVGPPLASGPDSTIFTGECTAGRHAGKKVAIKVQPRHKKTIYQITTENHALSVLGRTGARHLQQALAYGSHNDSCYVLVTELLGSNLLSLLPASGGVPARTTLLVAQQALEVLAGVHANGFVHRDIKPENLVLGNGAAESQVHLIDFGTAEALLDRNGARRAAPQRMEGTLPYMATTVHQKQPLSKRDDLESLAWTLVKLHLGALPWEALDMKKEKDVLKQKEACKKNVAALGEMSPFMRMFFDELLDAIWALRTEDDVDYPALLSLVKDAWRAGTPKKDFGAFPAAGKARLVV